MIKAEYIWIDGTEPTAQVRSKTKILSEGEGPPVWGFDGSSTNQADGSSSDCVWRRCQGRESNIFLKMESR